MNLHFFAVSLASFFLAGAPAVAQFEYRDFSVDFHNCTEFAGEGPVSLAVAQTLVPKDDFTITGASSGIANIVVRATSCEEVLVDREHPQPTSLSQIGINIVAPDGTGDINNYTFIYVSNNRYLVASFRRAGLPAIYDPQLTYEYNPATTKVAGSLYVGAGVDPLPHFFIYGPETEPPPHSAVPFLANWWYASSFGQMLQQTDIPNISFGTSSVTLFTSKNSVLGQLIGGNIFSDFSVLALRGVYPAGHMDVTLRRK